MDGSDYADTEYYYIAAGDTQKRDLYWHDREQAWLMYGCRNSGTTYWC
jgi:hypothetical protein